MSSRASLPLLALVIAIALGLGWMLLVRQPGQPRSNEIADAPETCAPCAPNKGTAPADAAQDAPALASPSSTVRTVEPASPASDQLPAFIDDDPLVAKQPLWVPDFGPGVARSGSSIEFEVVDAKGQEIEAGSIQGYELWRKLGRYWVQEQMRLDEARKTAYCDGYDQAGLEPGEYTLTLNAGPYGLVKQEFRISRGERRRERLTTPNWRRIISLRFEDHTNSPIAYIGSPPHYNPPGLVSTVAPARAAPTDVLREPPEPLSDVGRRDGFGSSSRRVRPGPPVVDRYPTDGGRWHLRVFAGAVGTIVMDMDKDLFGTTRWRVEGTFVEPEWDDYKVSFETPPDFAANMESRALQFGTNPGNKLLLSQPINPVFVQLDPNDLSNLAEGWQRLVISVSAPIAVTPVVSVENGVSQAKDKNPGPRPVKLNHHAASGKWWIDLAPDSGAWVKWSAPNLLQHDQRWGERVDLGSSRIVEHFRTLNFVSLNLARQSATLTAFGSRTRGDLFADQWSDGQSPWQADGTLKLWVRADSVAKLGPNPSGTVTLYAKNSNLRNAALSFTFTDAQKAELALYGTTVTPKARGLILRAIGPQLEGLPFVEATVVDEESDVASKRLRLDWMNAKAGKDDSFEESVGLLHELAGKDSKPDSPSALRLNQLIEQIKDPKSREFLRRNAAWYDTRFKLNSNSNGYLVSEKPLVAGKRYVLYLWSNSRDEFAPDKRIDFIATEGMTDLGAVMLPGYLE